MIELIASVPYEENGKVYYIDEVGLDCPECLITTRFGINPQKVPRTLPCSNAQCSHIFKDKELEYDKDKEA